jgi:hypothetical protein
MERVIIMLIAGIQLEVSQKRCIFMPNEGDVISFNAIIQKQDILSIEPVFDAITGDTPEALELMRFFRIDLNDPSQAEQLVHDLIAHPIVENAYVEPPARPAILPEG